MSGSDIESRASFDQIRYAQVWEDADILALAMRIRPGDVVVSIASAGDNALALLAEGAERVVAADLNPTQLACVRLRIAAYRLLSHGEVLELLGSRPSARRGDLLDRVARGLDAADQAFWAARKDDVIAHGAAGIGKFESYFRLFRRRVLPMAHSRATVDALLQPRDRAARARFFDETWDSWRWRALIGVFCSKSVMGRLGRDPAFFDHVEGSASAQVMRMTRHAMVEQDPCENPYLAWILKGTHAAALPRALTAERFDKIRSRLDRLELRLSTIEALAAEGVKADAFNLSDIFEYMSPVAHEAAYASVLAAAKPGARIVYWNMMAPRRVPASLTARVRTLGDLEAQLKPQDKAFFYGDFVIEEVR
jgi:S-adenosylmethionine-diacylglycerol 3-amino-3-carboxypropyl transferase